MREATPWRGLGRKMSRGAEGPSQGNGPDAADSRGFRVGGARRAGFPRWMAVPMDLVWGSPPLQAVLFLVCLASGYWGFTTYYGAQFARTPAWSWPFVPDSPLFTVLYVPAALLLLRPGRVLRGPPTWADRFAALAAAGLIQVGVWTMLVLLYYRDVFFAAGGEEALLRGVLLAAHGGMVALGLLLAVHVRPLSARVWTGILALLLAGDFVDYLLVPIVLPGSGLALYPNGIPSEAGRLRVVAVVTFLLSLATIALLVALERRGTGIAEKSFAQS